MRGKVLPKPLKRNRKWTEGEVISRSVCARKGSLLHINKATSVFRFL